MFWMFFEELGFFGVRQMILWVILLQMHPLTALYDPLGSCYDKVLYSMQPAAKQLWQSRLGGSRGGR